MFQGYALDDLEDAKNLPQGLDNFFMWSIQDELESNFRQLDEDSRSETFRHCCERLNDYVRDADGLEELTWEVSQFRDPGENLVDEDEEVFQEFAEEVMSKAYTEHLLKEFSPSFVKELVEISEMDIEEIRYQGLNESMLEGRKKDYSNKIMGIAEKSDTSGVTEYITQQYLSAEEASEKSLIESAINTLFASSESSYTGVLEDVEKLEPSKTGEYLDALDSLVSEERNRSAITITEEKALEELEELLSSASTHHGLAAETYDVVNLRMRESKGYGSVLTGFVEELYSEALENVRE